MTYSFAYRPLAEALYDSLAPDAFYIAMENSVSGEPADRREAMLRYYDFSMGEACRFGLLERPDAANWGASIWALPIDPVRSHQKEAQKKAFIREQMGAGSLDTYTRITDFMAAKTVPCVPSGSWYLSIIGIAPAFQGRGYGARLIQPTIHRAARLGRSVFLETFTARNKGFYRRLGFQDAGAFDEPVTQSRYWVMVRRPPETTDYQEVEDA